MIKLSGALFAAGLCVVAAVVLEISVARMSHMPRPAPIESMRVRLPLVAQVLVAGGDRYLASNIGTFRAISVGVGRLDRATLDTLASVQDDAAWLNPGQEDNYYTAEAILPWEGYFDETQRILVAATHARPLDLYPPFYYGFNRYYFLHDAIGSSKAVEVAAARAQGGIRSALLNIAGKWGGLDEDENLAISILESLRKKAEKPELRLVFDLRIKRVHQMADLRRAVMAYREKFGKYPVKLDALKASGLIETLPIDPLGDGYLITPDGNIGVKGQPNR